MDLPEQAAPVDVLEVHHALCVSRHPLFRDAVDLIDSILLAIGRGVDVSDYFVQGLQSVSGEALGRLKAHFYSQECKVHNRSHTPGGQSNKDLHRHTVRLHQGEFSGHSALGAPPCPALSK